MTRTDHRLNSKNVLFISCDNSHPTDLPVMLLEDNISWLIFCSTSTHNTSSLPVNSRPTTGPSRLLQRPPPRSPTTPRDRQQPGQATWAPQVLDTRAILRNPTLPIPDILAIEVTSAATGGKCSWLWTWHVSCAVNARYTHPNQNYWWPTNGMCQKCMLCGACFDTMIF